METFATKFGKTEIKNIEITITQLNIISYITPLTITCFFGLYPQKNASQFQAQK